MDSAAESGEPRLTLRPESELLSDFLLAGQRTLMKHPQAARALTVSLMQEGRRFAQTEEGQRWLRDLAGSELVQRALLIWEAYGMDLLVSAEPAITPSSWLDMLMSAVANPDLEGILSLLIVEEMRVGNVANT
jgi:hypothetical protein